MINSLNSLESLQNTCAESDCAMILITYYHIIIVNNNIICSLILTFCQLSNNIIIKFRILA